MCSIMVIAYGYGVGVCEIGQGVEGQYGVGC
jgi:hypothetical protein